MVRVSVTLEVDPLKSDADERSPELLLELDDELDEDEVVTPSTVV